MAQLDAPSDWRQGGHGFNPRWDRQHSFVEIDHKIFSMGILSLPLTQEGQLSVSGERMCTILVNLLCPVYMHKFAPRGKYTPRGKLVMRTHLPLGAKFTHVGKLPQLNGRGKYICP